MTTALEPSINEVTQRRVRHFVAVGHTAQVLSTCRGLSKIIQICVTSLMNGPLLDPSFRSLYCKESDHGRGAVVVVEGLDVPGPSLHDRSHGSFKTKDEKFTPEKRTRPVKTCFRNYARSFALCMVAKSLLEWKC